MRIALVAHHVRPTGGQDRYVLELARALAGRHEVHVLAVGVEGLEGTGVVVHRFDIRDRPVLWLAPEFARRTALTANGAGFDVIHAIGGALPGATVITAQYCHAAWHEARDRYRVREGSPLMAWYQRKVGAQAVDFERRAYAHPALQRVIAVSARTATELGRHYGVAQDRVTVVPNGVDPSRFDRALHANARAWLRAALGLARDTPLALLVGTYARKGLDTAIAAVARASATLHLVVAGAGSARAARRWAAAAGLTGRLHLLGSRTDVAALYAAADLFLLPTRYEPFGMVITEAMASGLPVVVSGCAGAADLIRDGANSFVVEAADDADGFAAAIRTILADPARAAAIGAAAREAVLPTAWPRVVAATEAVYGLAAGTP